MYKSYTEWAVQRFVNWQTLPSPETEWTTKAKRIRNSYLLLARTILFLAQVAPDMDFEEWIESNTSLAYRLNDTLALLKDSADWGVCAIEIIEPVYAIHSSELELLSRIETSSFRNNNKILAKTFNRTFEVLQENCQLNIRLRNAVVRLFWAFTAADELIQELKSENPVEYLKKLNYPYSPIRP